MFKSVPGKKWRKSDASYSWRKTIKCRIYYNVFNRVRDLSGHNLHREIIDLTKDLVRIPSTHSRPEEIHRCARFIEEWLRLNNISSMRYDSGKTPSISVVPDSNHADVLLMSHFDVVEAEDDMFSPIEEGGKLYGRGTIDDKYGVALSLVLFREHLRMLESQGKSQQDMKFGLLFTGDEEIGGANGAAIAVRYLSTDFFIALDGGRPDMIVTREKGILQLELTARGTAAHAARPWLGSSAFDLLIEDYGKIQQLFNEKADDHWHKTMALTKCAAGNGSSNMVPEKASAVFDIRYTENDDPEALIAEIRRRVKSDITVNAKEPTFMSAPSPYIDLLADHSNGAAVGFEHGASDARYLSALGVPGVIWGAEGEMSQHSADEHVVLSSMAFLYDRLDSFLTTQEKELGAEKENVLYRQSTMA